MPVSVKINQIRVDGGTQSRARLNERHVQHLVEVLSDHGKLDPIDVIYDGADYWLWDGFHRLEAYRRARRSIIPTHVTPGTQRDAILKSCGANGRHGLPRTNADKRRAVTRLLEDEEWRAWPDSQLARAASVSREYVVRVRAELREQFQNLSCDRSQDRTVIRDGKSYTMNTANIGKTDSEPTSLHPTGADDSASPDILPAPSYLLLPDKWYPIKHGEKAIYNHPFDSQREGAADPRYHGHAIQSGRLITQGILTGTNYATYRIVEPPPALPRRASDGHLSTEDGVILRYVPGADRGWCATCGEYRDFRLAGQDLWACKVCDHRVSDELIMIYEPPAKSQSQPGVARPTPPSTPDEELLADLREAQRLLRKHWERLPQTRLRESIDLAMLQIHRAIKQAEQPGATSLLPRAATTERTMQ